MKRSTVPSIRRNATSFLGRRLIVGTSAALGSIVLLASPALAADQANVQINTKNVQQLSNGLAYYALAACMVGIVVSASLWAMGSKGQNPGQELTGKKGIVLCVTAAFFIGALSPLVKYLNTSADKVQSEWCASSSSNCNADSGLGVKPDKNQLSDPLHVPQGLADPNIQPPSATGDPTADAANNALKGNQPKPAANNTPAKPALNNTPLLPGVGNGSGSPANPFGLNANPGATGGVSTDGSNGGKKDPTAP